jgi:hypothetical protein
MDVVMDQYEHLSQLLPTTGATAAVPTGHLTAAQRTQVKRTFSSPRFEVAVAGDDTIRQLNLSSKFTTPAANREAAGGITGGRIEYRLQYTDVGKATSITPPTSTQPIGDFARQLQKILASK